MNIDIYATKYTFEEIAQQCKDAVLRNDYVARLNASTYTQSYESAAYKQGDCYLIDSMSNATDIKPNVFNESVSHNYLMLEKTTRLYCLCR